MKTAGCARYIALHVKKTLVPGESVNIRYLRGMQSLDEEEVDLKEEAARVLDLALQPFLMKTSACLQAYRGLRP